MGKAAVMENPVRESQVIPPSPKEEAKKDLRRFMEEECRLVKGRFRSYKTPGEVVPITFKKYPTRMEMLKRGEGGGVEPFSKSMKDNEVYEIPLYVARFLNGTDITARSLDGKVHSCSYPIHEHMMNGSDFPKQEYNEFGAPKPMQTHTRYERRFGFESLEFGG